MDIKARQIWSKEQEVILEALAEASARPGCLFLEVGSWCGDSAVVLGRVARRAGGTLLCVDWWKGNIGTELADIASKVDIFAVFWKRIRAEGLGDVVVPLRDRSDRAARTVRPAAFDLVFLDGDHRYSAATADIRNYQRVVRSGGILCGHDCEGPAATFDAAFLEIGKEVDCYQSVHCGVVLAVAEAFPACTIKHSVWSVQRGEKDRWQPTRVEYPNIADLTQGPVPPIACTREAWIYRYRRSLYALPRSIRTADVRLKETRNDPDVRNATQLSKLEKDLGESVVAMPAVVDSHLGFTLVSFRGHVVALADSVAPLDLTTSNEQTLGPLREQGLCVDGESVDEVKVAIEAAWRSKPSYKAAGEAKVAELEAALAETASKVALLEQRLAGVDQRAIECVDKGTATEERVSELEQASKAHSATIPPLQQQLADQATAISRAESVIEAFESKLSDVTAELTKTRELLNTNERRAAEIERTLEAQAAKALSLEHDLTGCVAAFERLQDALGGVGLTIRDLATKLRDLGEAHERHREGVAERNDKIQSIEQALSRNEQIVVELQKVVDHQRRNMSKLVTELSDRNTCLKSLRADLTEAALELELQALGVETHDRGRPLLTPLDDPTAD